MLYLSYNYVIFLLATGILGLANALPAGPCINIAGYVSRVISVQLHEPPPRLLQLVSHNSFAQDWSGNFGPAGPTLTPLCSESLILYTLLCTP